MLKKQTEKIEIPPKIVRESRIAIIRSEFNSQITESLERHCLKILLSAGIKRSQIKLYQVPGSLEIPVTAQRIAQKRRTDLIIALGAVIRGDTYHFELVANECARGCMDVSLKYGIPIIFEVLATYNSAQATKRAANDSNNKGREAAIAALKMLKTLSELNA